MIPAAMQRLITDWRLGHIATVLPDGRPNVSPKGTFLVVDDATLAFGEIRSPGTLAGIAHEPRVEVNFVDAFTRKGCRVRGDATVHPRGSDGFDALLPRFSEVWGDLCDRMGAIITVAVSEVRPLTTPPYDTGATEAEMVAHYKDRFARLHP